MAICLITSRFKHVVWLKEVLIDINKLPRKNPKSPYIMVAMVTIQNNVNFKMTTYLGLHAYFDLKAFHCFKNKWMFDSLFSSLLGYKSIKCFLSYLATNQLKQDPVFSHSSHRNIICYHFSQPAILGGFRVFTPFKSMGEVNWCLEDEEKLLFNVKPEFATS